MNFVDTNNPFYDDYCEFSNYFVQEIYLDTNLNFRASRKLTEKDELGEEKKMISAKEESEKKKLKRNKLGEQKELVATKKIRKKERQKSKEKLI